MADVAPDAQGDPTPPVEQARSTHGHFYEGIEPQVWSENEYGTSVTFSRAGQGIVAVLLYERVGNGWLRREERRCSDPPDDE